MISPIEYQENLANHTIVDCIVRSRDMCGLIVHNDSQACVASAISEAKVNKRLVTIYLDEPFGRRLGTTEVTGFQTLMGAGPIYPVSQFVCVDAFGQVYVLGSGVDEFQEDIPRSLSGPVRGAVGRLKTIAGWLFIVGGFHSVAKRIDKDVWENLCLNLRAPTKADSDNVHRLVSMDLCDVDGFSENELYAVGGKGRVWRLCNGAWARMPFPSNMYMESVCCAGDGFVYIGAQSGALFRGRDEHWEMIHGPEFTLPFQDIVWHAGRLCTSDYGLWTLENGRLVSADVPSEVRVCAGHLSVGDGVMLMAGVHGAAVHDGKDWQVIFTKLHMEEAIKG